ncbi:hypothetical protein LTR97_007402 [Elasticomyces elasticus]|uniref:BTB domain-containing protein n=1 Tax=Elasticomyces elasticus TaxID=574655 RepID=A0AAN7ZMT1_9PEZI|nr:hypothetical protein LTR97_007402 [Elasticomyces elasticus]
MPPTTTPASAGGTKRSFSGTPLVGNNRMATLYNPTMVSIIVEEDDEIKKYQVPCGLLRASPEYFDKAFGEHFAEAKNGEIKLPDTKAWVVECFFGWLYSQKVFWEHQDSRTLRQPKLEDDVALDTDGVQGNLSNDELLDPVTWNDDDLLDLYIFADKYSTRRLRNSVIGFIQTKLFQTKPVEYKHWALDTCGFAFAHLPEASPLYKLLMDMIVHDVEPESITKCCNYEFLPTSALCQLLARTAQLARRANCRRCRNGHGCRRDGSHEGMENLQPPYVGSFCLYHEHDSEEEQKICEIRWKKIKAEKAIGI